MEGYVQTPTRLQEAKKKLTKLNFHMQPESSRLAVVVSKEDNIKPGFSRYVIDFPKPMSPKLSLTAWVFP